MARNVISIGSCALALAIVCGGQSSAIAAARQWAPVDGAALAQLYAGKTWRWKNGAAYFAPDGGFKAWSRSKRELTEGFGTWKVRDDGVMCFNASWGTVPTKPGEASSPKVDTCFEHQARGNALAQMKLPDGVWYFFRHGKPRKTDEVFKLRPGDHTRFTVTD